MIDWLAQHGNAGIVGLLFFFIFFSGLVVWVFRPNSGKYYLTQAQIPLKEDGTHD